MENAMYLAAMTTDRIIEECEILHVSGLLALQVVVMGVVGQLLGLLVMVVVDWVVVVVVVVGPQVVLCRVWQVPK